MDLSPSSIQADCVQPLKPGTRYCQAPCGTGASTPTDLMEANNTHTITGNALKFKFGRHCSNEHKIALNQLSAILNTDSTTVTMQDIAREIT
jgi:hypothetical protein